MTDDTAAQRAAPANGSPRTAEYTFVQYHNQAATTALHRRLSEMWAAVRHDTGGRVDTQVFASNNKVPGSDPAALKMLMAGDIQFFTLMGGILGNLVPVAYAQQAPFAFRSAAQAHKVVDGPIGAMVCEELAAKGIYGFPGIAFDNGLRQISTSTRPINIPDDLHGMKIRLPDGEMFTDTFKALGAVPVTINVDGIYEGLKTGKVDAQENPISSVESFKFYEVQKYVSMTNHMWSGFNLMAHLLTWQRLPDDIKAAISRNALKYVRLQRADQEETNGATRALLARRGMIINDVDQAPFRARLDGVYAKWRERLGTKCWSLLEAEVGRLG